MPAPIAVVPVKPFLSAKRRLAPALEPLRLALLVRAVAARVVGACRGAGTTPLVIAGDDAVAGWAGGLGADVVADPGGGLNGAAAAGIAMAVDAGVPWCVVHADLPLLDQDDVATVVGHSRVGRIVLAPSRDGGTNLLAGTARFATRYGQGSFGLHLAAASGLERVVVVRTGTAVDLDTPADLHAAAVDSRGRWLRPLLG